MGTRKEVELTNRWYKWDFDFEGSRIDFYV